MTHRPHPDVHTDGLADDCDGCFALANDPLGLADAGLLRRWIDKVIPADRDLDGSGNELLARAHVLTALERAGKLLSTHPAGCVEYLSRWRISTTITQNR